MAACHIWFMELSMIKMVSHVCFYQLINQSVQETLVINADKTQDYGSFK
jgi:hypothetical protein